MKSYASIDRIEGKFAVCEVELIAVEQSRPEDFATKETEMLDILLQEIPESLGEIDEEDILVVEHDGKTISTVYSKDEEEKKRRVDLLRSIMAK